jgi:transaldolase
VKIFADGAKLEVICDLCRNPVVEGFTTNPTLMAKAGVSDYERFAISLLAVVRNRPVSFEVLADDFPGMERQARRIASWATNVWVKIPIANCEGKSSLALVRHLARAGVQVNVTAVMTCDQVLRASGALSGGAQSFVSVFAGRIADTGRDPLPLMRTASQIVARYPEISLIWASAREVLNVYQADECGCDAITLSPELIAKLPLEGKDLDQSSLDTVRQFCADAERSGLTL